MPLDVLRHAQALDQLRSLDARLINNLIQNFIPAVVHGAKPSGQLFLVPLQPVEEPGGAKLTDRLALCHSLAHLLDRSIFSSPLV